METIKTARNMTNRKYRAIWQDSNREAARQLCNLIRRKIDARLYTWEEFDKGYQFRNIFAENYKTAKDEFINLVMGNF